MVGGQERCVALLGCSFERVTLVRFSWKNPEARERLMMRESIAGVQGPTKGGQRSRPHMKDVLSASWDHCSGWQEARMADEGENSTLGELQMKSLLGTVLPAFLKPVLVLRYLAWECLLLGVLFCLQLTFSLTGDYSFTSFCIRTYCLVFF